MNGNRGFIPTRHFSQRPYYLRNLENSGASITILLTKVGGRLINACSVRCRAMG